MPSTFGILLVALLFAIAAESMRRAKRFSLATLFIAMMVFCVVLGVSGAMR